MKILVINSGSSSIKYQLLQMEDKSVLCSGVVEKIGEAKGIITHKKTTPDGIQKTVIEEYLPTHHEGMMRVVDLMMNGDTAVIHNTDEIKGVGHRIVHGGTYSHPEVVTPELINYLEEISCLAPLHNPAHIIGIKVAQEIFNHATHICVFDTAFHQTMPDYAFMYPLPKEYYEVNKIRKYGFHGTSHRYVSKKALEVLKNPNANVIVAHLGNGSSLTAVKGGVCIDTSMGLTPLDGVMMGTRTGSIDPATVTYLIRNVGLSVEEADTLITKKSGLLGICGLNDMRDVHAAIKDGNKDAELAFNMLCYRIKGFIGNYMAQLGHTDAIIFTAGIGENDEFVRAKVLDGMEEFGIKIDPQLNSGRKSDVSLISASDSKIKVYVIPTNEELAIAEEVESRIA